VRDDVVLTPAQPKYATAFEPEAMPQAAAEAAPASGEPFIPPQAERVVRAPRMPRIDELPPHMHGQIRASRGDAEPAAAAPEQKRMTLLPAPRDGRFRRPQGRDRGARGPGRGAASRRRAGSA
jgi:cell division protein FtsZ